jgi:hypothetical protein
MKKTFVLPLVVAVSCCFSAAVSAQSLGNAFSYQGQAKKGTEVLCV